jgi:hypothetical protein
LLINCENPANEPLHPQVFITARPFFIPALYLRRPIDLASLWSLSPFSQRLTGEPVDSRGHTMRLGANNPISLGALDDALRNARQPSLDLFSKIINSACTRVQARGQALTHIVRLAEIGAWTEAAFALIALELPLWAVRRLACENGEWLCSLSRQPNLPITFEDCAEASHEVLPLAMLCAFLEACRRCHRAQEPVSAVPQVAQPSVNHIMCCENYR